MSDLQDLTPELVLYAYRKGIFPMARTRDDPAILWIEPVERGVLPLDSLKVSHSLKKTLRRNLFSVSMDQNFDAVIRACAETSPDWKDRGETWINGPISDVFRKLFRLGFAHSIECRQDGKLVGGLYGLALGGAFFGESMFSRVSDASKVALCHLVARMRKGGYVLLDTQFTTVHLRKMGAIDIPRSDYLEKLEDAVLRDDAIMSYFMTNDEALAILSDVSFNGERSLQWNP